MTAALLAEACRFTLAIAFAAAALGKARAVDRFAETLEALAPLCFAKRRWRRGAAIALIAAELGVALALLAGETARHGAAAALALLAGFTAVLIVALARSQRVHCNCFGAGDHPISGGDVIRNGLLMATALAQLWSGAPPAALSRGEALLALAAAALFSLAVPHLRRLARAPRADREAPDAPGAAIDAAIDAAPDVALGVALGQQLPAFEGRGGEPARRVAASELAGQAAVLLFLSSGCPKCRRVLPALLELLPAIRRAGVGLWILPADPRHDLAALLEGSALREHALFVEPAALDRLNPRRVAPAYLFLDHHTVALASGLIGDDDWLSFAEQLGTSDEAAAAEPASEPGAEATAEVTAEPAERLLG